jgi:hypothetical protein
MSRYETWSSQKTSFITTTTKHWENLPLH